MDSLKNNYKDWHLCIQRVMGEKFNKDYINNRLEILKNKNHSETIKFSKHYGEEYLQRIIKFFEKALEEINK